jgi:hypothetical protein
MAFSFVQVIPLIFVLDLWSSCFPPPVSYSIYHFIRLTATVAWKPPWTGKLGGSNILDRVQRHPVTHPVKPRTRSRSAICRGRLDSNPPRAPGGRRSHLPLPRASQRRRPLASPPPSRLPLPPPSSAYAPSPLLCTSPPHPPRRRRFRCLPVILAVAAHTVPPRR